MRGHLPNCPGSPRSRHHCGNVIFPISHFISILFSHIYLFHNPSLSFRVFYLFLPLFRSEGSLDSTCTLITSSIIASMEDLANMLANNFHLTGKEDDEVDGVDNLEEGSTDEPTFDLVGRVVSEKTYSSYTLQSNIERLLRSVKGFQFNSLGENKFTLSFNHPFDHTHALEGYLWLLDRSALLLSRIPEGANPEMMDLNTITIAVRLVNIPQPYRKPKIAQRLCAKFGAVVEVIPPRGTSCKPISGSRSK